MNQRRRKSIDEAVEPLRAIIEQLETLRDEEQEYYDNMPESLQQGERGTQAEGNVSVLEEMISKLEEVEQDVGNIEGGT